MCPGCAQHTMHDLHTHLTSPTKAPGRESTHSHPHRNHAPGPYRESLAGGETPSEHVQRRRQRYVVLTAPQRSPALQSACCGWALRARYGRQNAAPHTRVRVTVFVQPCVPLSHSITRCVAVQPGAPVRPTGASSSAGLNAGGEVLLAAGAIHSPQVLMASGVGPSSHLAEHGIDVVADLPGVGSNLQDHPAVLSAFRFRDDAGRVSITDHIYDDDANIKPLQARSPLTAPSPPCSPLPALKDIFVRMAKAPAAFVRREHLMHCAAVVPPRASASWTTSGHAAP